MLEFFSVLLQCDSTFAKHLFSTLFRGVFSQVEEKLSEREAVSVTSDIMSAVNNMVSSSTQFFPPFISSVQVCSLYSWISKYSVNFCCDGQIYHFSMCSVVVLLIFIEPQTEPKG